MSRYRYTGASPAAYPLIGGAVVSPGDVVDLQAPPDANWVSVPAGTAITIAYPGDGMVQSWSAVAGGPVWTAQAAYIPGELSVGQETFPRTSAVANVNINNGFLRLAFFTSRKSELVGNIRSSCGNVAAAATPTLCRMGLYSVDAPGNLSLIGACANDPTLWSSTTTRYTRPLITPVNVFAGLRYAFAALCVTSVTAPNLSGNGPTGDPQELFTAPMMVAQLSGQTDLPASIPVGSLTAAVNTIYGVITP